MLASRFTAFALFLLSACSSSDCGIGYEEGEQFRITVVEKLSEEGTICSEHFLPELAVGESFVIEGGALTEAPHSCNNDVRGGRFAQMPAAWTDLLAICGERDGPLGIGCMWSNECAGFIDISIGPEIQSEDTVIEDGTLGIYWSRLDCPAPEETRGSCNERYHVRMERL